MQAKDKEKRNFKRFSKRFLSLSGIRRGKRSIPLYGESSFSLDDDLDETIGPKDPGSANRQDITSILNGDPEATVSLVEDAPENLSNGKDIAEKLLPDGQQTAELRADNNAVQNALSPGPPLPQLELGDCMNTSRDSGIDCNVLLSENSSPEQFIAFSRREAERIRQEHLQYMNGSVLETLVEVDRSSSEDGDAEGASPLATGGTAADTADITLATADVTISLDNTCDSVVIEKQSKDDGKQLTDNEAESNSEESFTSNATDSISIVNSCENIYKSHIPDLELKNINESQCVLGQMLASDDETLEETLVEDPNRSGDSVGLAPLASNSDISITASMEQYLLNSVENKTDERKSAEARVQQSADIDCPHLIVSPIAVRSAAVAGHKTIPPTPTPASLYINENSAFAKCKSIKRSVSDVGKGILGKLRHKKKEHTVPKTRNGNATEDKLKYEAKKFISGRLKRSSKKKDKLGKGEKDLNESVLIVDVTTDKKVDGYTSDTNLYVKAKSPVTKEVLYNNRHPVLVGSIRDNKVCRKSPVVKEVLSDFEKRHLSQNCSSPETIEDLTNSIAEMTSKLCAPGHSSAESIACICDCKRRSSDQECCDKRRTPTPPGLQPSSPGAWNKSIHLEVAGDNIVETRTLPGSGNDCDETSKLLDDFEQTCDFNYASGEEMTDTDDTETDSDGECSDPNCSDCCKTSENNSCSLESSSDSDDDKLSKLNAMKRLNNRDSTESSSTSDTSTSSSPVETTVNDSSQKHDISEYDVTFRELDSSPGPRNIRHSNADVYNSVHLSDSSKVSTGFDSPASEAGLTDFEVSPSAYKEFDHENGDVMYLGNASELFQDSFFINPCDTSDVSSPYSRLPSETPASSPRNPNSSLEETPVMLNRSQNCSLPSQSRGCRKKDTFINHQVRGDHNSSYRKTDSRLERDSASPLSTCNTSGFRRSYSQNEKLCKPQSPRSEDNQSYTKLRRSNSSVDSPNRSFTRPAPPPAHSLNSSLHRSFNGLDVSTNEGYERSFRADSNYDIKNCLNESKRHNSSVLSANHSFTHLNSSVSGLNSSVVHHKRTSRQLNASYSGLDSSIHGLETSYRRHNSSIRSLNASYSGLNSSIRSHNESFSRSSYTGRTSLSSSYLQDVMSTPPLDLSMSKLRKDQSRHDKWIGQIYSPADRVLHKNRGMSETDLCRQILDLYVSDAEESGFEMPSEVSGIEADSPEKPRGRLAQNSPVLQYGKYVAPRNVVKETNVDDFTTKVVRKCYTAEARTRKIQEGEDQPSILQTEEDQGEEQTDKTGPGVRGEPCGGGDLADQSVLDESTADLSISVLESTRLEESDDEETGEDTGNSSLQKNVRDKPRTKVRGRRKERQALQDRTNLPLSSLEVPSVSGGIDPDSLLEEAQEESQALLTCEKSFDRLTQLYTVHNGRRKVKCLTLNESQSVIKHFPPPKEASRVSWGQTISELDLYRHSPRRTPLKTRPILTQKENNFPYDEDTPSPIVLTKMRKPKSLAKRYKNWPWY